MDIMEFAINMEIEGENFYNEQADRSKDDRLKTVMLMLANEEKHHAELLVSKSKELQYQLIKSNTISDAESIFKGLKDFKSDIKEFPDQLDFYRMALDKEQQSIELYNKLLLEVTDDKSKELFEYIIDQEKDHYKIIEELVLLLKHAKDWVESAEFGIREEEY